MSTVDAASLIEWWDHAGPYERRDVVVFEMLPEAQQILFDHEPGLRERVEQYAAYRSVGPPYRAPMPVMWFGDRC
jgi:hypothetical protein